MKPEIIVMLTHHDVTVPGARDLFQECLDLPVTFWGFKDAGVTPRHMERLVRDFRAAGKTPVLEVVSFDEKELSDAADVAIDCGVEYFTGSSFSAPVAERLRDNELRYFPFCGDVGGSPIVLTGSVDDVVADAARVRELGADGVDLVAYRFAAGDPTELAAAVAERVGRDHTVIAGSINSVDRMERMHSLAPFAYTMGGALFEGAFVSDGTFRENLQRVLELQASMAGAGR